MIISTIFMPNKVEATFTIDRADLYSKGNYIDYLYWSGMGLVFDYVVYEKDGKKNYFTEITMNEFMLIDHTSNDEQTATKQE